MGLKKIKIILLILLFYQTDLYSKSNSFDNVDYKNLSRYFSGIVASGNKNESKALDFYNSSKVLINKHDPYLKNYVYSLVSENKVLSAINLIKSNTNKKNSKFLEAYLLLIVDSLKKNNFKEANKHLSEAFNLANQDRFNLALLETLKSYIFVFKENKILNNEKNYGKLSLISETFQRCYLGHAETSKYFSNLVNSNGGDYSRYIFFYLNHLIEQNKINEAYSLVRNVKFINSTLLLSQGKDWVENEKFYKFKESFSCKSHNDITSEFFFIISNLYSTENNFEKSNFFLSLSNYLNPKFIFNLYLVVENQLSKKQFKEAKKTLKSFKKENTFYYWYRIKKETQIISIQKNKTEALNYIMGKFKNIEKVNNKILFDIANFNRNSKNYDQAIEYYSKLLESFDNDPEIKSDILYRRGGSFERLGNYEKADIDLLNSLKLNSEDAYVLNYLAYSWLERNFKIDEAIEMLEIAYAAESNDPYIIDSIGWAYFLIDDFLKAEEFMKRAVELMPDDPIVNDHYGDILWKLNRKIQARYFWARVLKMEDADVEILEKINIKLIDGLKNS